jgi:hypothetical protein
MDEVDRILEQQPENWYHFADKLSQDTRCPQCEGVGVTTKRQVCPTCMGVGEILLTGIHPNIRSDYRKAHRQARCVLRRVRTKPTRNGTQIAFAGQGALSISVHLPRPYDQPLFCLQDNSPYSRQIAVALAQTLAQQGCAV